jgi:SAM-dependent methyltransferase
MKLEVPAELCAGKTLPNESRPQAGARVLRSMLDVIGRADAKGLSILDVGCGDRLTHAIVNLDIEIGAYCGLDTRKPLIDWMNAHVHDPRFRYHHVDYFNSMYCPTGQIMSKGRNLGISGRFDLVFAQSLFSHLYPHEADIMLFHMRSHVEPGGQLLFTCFLSDDVVLFEDKHWDHPLVRFYYHPDVMRQILRKNGWEIVRRLKPGLMGFGQGNQDAMLCRPSEMAVLPAGFGETPPDSLPA